MKISNGIGDLKSAKALTPGTSPAPGQLEASLAPYQTH